MKNALIWDEAVSQMWGQLTCEHIVAVLSSISEMLTQYQCDVWPKLDDFICYGPIRTAAEGGLNVPADLNDLVLELEVLGTWIACCYHGYPRDFFGCGDGSGSKLLWRIIAEITAKISAAN